MSYALSLDPALGSLEAEIDGMLPDTESDGRWEASYALNTGCMMLNLVDVLKGQSGRSYEEAVTSFFDTVDFKVQRMLIESGIEQPTEEQIASHSLMQRERQWFSAHIAQ